MKNKILLLSLLIWSISEGQTFTTNEFPVGMEHNVLFNASSRFTVTQTGTATLNTATLFDGKFVPSYTSTEPTQASPTIILIEGLPNVHTQLGAWVGWATRYWEALRFKVEGYDSYQSANVWKTIVDYSNQDYTGGRKFIQKISNPGVYTKLRFTFYAAVGSNGRLGVAELFFIHPEAVRPYEGLLSSGITLNQWLNNTSDLYYNTGNVGIGTTTPDSKLTVAGKIHAQEVKVTVNAGADFVFNTDYKLPKLEDVERFIKENKHLPEIASEKEMQANGIHLAEMNIKLLQKIEELTLYTIQQEKEIKRLKKQENIIRELEERLLKLEQQK